MSGLSPKVIPLDPATGNLTTSQHVDVSVFYSDIGSRDQTLVKWGIYDPIPGPGATPESPVQLVPVPARHICDGYATVWFSITDAIGNVGYSSLVQVSIATGTQVLAAPQVTAANPASPGAGMLATVKDDPAFDLVLTAGDTLVLAWNIYAASGGAALSTHSEQYILPAGTQGSYTTPPIYQIPIDTQYVAVTYTLTRTQANGGLPSPNSEQQFTSAATKKSAQDLWPGGGPTQLPAPVFLDAVAGALNLDSLQGDIRLQIPQTPALVNKNVDFEGSGQDASGQGIAAASWTSGPVPVSSTPYASTPVPRADVDAVPTGGSYSVYYQGAGSISPTTKVTIQRGAARPPGGAGDLWGWGDPEYGTLGQ